MNIYVTRHGESETPEYYGHNCNLTHDGTLQMLNLGDTLSNSTGAPMTVLESPLKRSIESTDCILEGLDIYDAVRIQMDSLSDTGTAEGITEFLDTLPPKQNVLIMTHNPVIYTVVKNLLGNQGAIAQIEQGACFHLKRLPSMHPHDLTEYQLLNVIHPNHIRQVSVG